MTDTDWLIPGAEVAEYPRDQALTWTTVEHLTATLVVLGNGSKYRLPDLRRVGEKSSAYGKSYIRPGAEIRAQLVRAIPRNVAAVVMQAADRHSWDGDDVGEVLDAMQVAIDDARRTLAELTGKDGEQ
jgi:hypothetical protein